MPLSQLWTALVLWEAQLAAARVVYQQTHELALQSRSAGDGRPRKAFRVLDHRRALLQVLRGAELAV